MFQSNSNKILIKLKLIISISLSILIFVFFIFHSDGALANYGKENLKISYVIGDSYTTLVLKLIKSNDIKNLNLNITLYPKGEIKRRDLSFLRQSDLIFIDIMGRILFYELKEDLSKAISRGAKVYALSGKSSYNEEVKRLGIIYDPIVDEYYSQGGIDNLRNMLFYALKRDFNYALEVEPVRRVPEFAIYDRVSGKIFETFDAYYQAKGEDYFRKPSIGIVFYKNSYVTGQISVVNALIEALEREGFSVIPVFGFPGEVAVERFFFDEEGRSRVRAVIGLSLKVGLNPQVASRVFEKLGVPVLNAITLYNMTRSEWENSPIGLNIMERSWQIAQPEMGGIIQPTIVATKEKILDPETGQIYIEDTPIPERIERLIKRVKAWINLQDKQNSEKRVAIIYYNYPPGKQNIGASYLNVLPESLWNIYERLKKEGYRVDESLTKEHLFREIMRYGRNIGNWAPKEIDELARSGRAILIPIETYKEWFKKLPKNFQKKVLEDWGPPENSKIMLWKDQGGKKYILIPGLVYGNILFTPQPSRGWEQDIKKIYHDISISPHHQYIAFYLYLRNTFKADAIIHLGTHGTHEWLPGKEVGFSQEDPPEVLIEDLPNIYPYIVDNLGEGTQAKRRGLAVIIDHMTPPFDEASSYDDLRVLLNLIDSYKTAKEKNPALAEAKLVEINKLAEKKGLLVDLNLSAIKSEEELETLEEHLKEITEQKIPFGLHTFGRSPDEDAILATAKAMVSLDKNVDPEAREALLKDYQRRLKASGDAELESLIRALEGKYVRAGPGGDPLRNPNSLPTGKNFYSFDPSRIPSKTTYELAVKLANDLLEDYFRVHNRFPDKLTFTLWGTETMRHEGVMEAQILFLLGVRPKWDERGRIYDLELIPQDQLKRPRPDIVIVPSGLYRDLFPNLLALIDRAITLVRELNEEENHLRKNFLEAERELREMGVPEDLASRLASVRIFTVPPGAYGPNLDKVIPLSHTWREEKEIAEVFFMRMGHLYGQGFWGEAYNIKNFNQSSQELHLYLFKKALSGTKIALHSRSTNTFATLDNDDFFQYLGGIALAIRVIDGKTPMLVVTNLSNPFAPKQESLERFMGRELRARYLNPKWIEKMLKEGYGGARFIDKVVEHLWGWQVVTPEIIDHAKWQEMYEVYVKDRYNLKIKDAFRNAGNLWAYQSIVARMLEVIRKGYWQPEREVTEFLAREFAETVKEVGLACCDHTCNNPFLREFTKSVLLSIPLPKDLLATFLKAYENLKMEESTQGSSTKHISQNEPSGVPHPQGKLLEGFELEVHKTASAGYSSAPLPYLYLLFSALFLALILFGFRKGKL